MLAIAIPSAAFGGDNYPPGWGITCKIKEFREIGEAILWIAKGADTLGNSADAGRYYDALYRGVERTVRMILSEPAPKPPCGDYLKAVLDIGRLLGLLSLDEGLLSRYRKHAERVANECITSGELSYRFRASAPQMKMVGNLHEPVKFKRKETGVTGKQNSLNSGRMVGAGVRGKVYFQASIRSEAKVKIKPPFLVQTKIKLVLLTKSLTAELSLPSGEKIASARQGSGGAIQVGLKDLFTVSGPGIQRVERKLTFPFKEKAEEKKRLVLDRTVGLTRNETWSLELEIDPRPKENCGF